MQGSFVFVLTLQVEEDSFRSSVIEAFDYTPRVMSTEEVFSEMKCEIKKVFDIAGLSFGGIYNLRKFIE
jgi:hypothetical protein